MTHAQLIADGWRNHAAAPLEVVARLEAHVALVTDDAEAQAFTALAAHAGGAHAGEWARAAQLCESAAARCAGAASEAMAAALGSWASMQFLAGDVAAALASETRAAAMMPAATAGVFVRTRLLIADALGQQGRLDESRAVYESARLLAESGAPLGVVGERAVAATSNNLASALLVRARSAADDALMLRAAHASRAFWLRAGTWENDERSSYLLALVFNALGRHDDARLAASAGLAVIAAHGPEDVDAAFLTLQLAAAHRGDGDADEYARQLAAADALAATFADDAALAPWFADERAKVVER